MSEEQLPPPEDELPLPPQEAEPPQEPEAPKEPEPPQEPEPPKEPEPPRDMEPPREATLEPDQFSELKTKKSGPVGALRRSFTIFGKDLRTMAKHGLVGSIILAVLLAIAFSAGSYVMSMAFEMEFGDGEGDGEGDGDDIDLPGATESIPPVADAGSDRTVDAGEFVPLDGSGSTDNEEIVYYMWTFNDNGLETELYGPVTGYTFMAAGEYEIRLMVVDSSWNDNEDSFMLTVESTGSDFTPPMAAPGSNMDIVAGTTVGFDGSNSTDDTGIVNWTWRFEDIVQTVLYGERPSYTFRSTGNFEVSLVVRDDSGNTGFGAMWVNVMPSGEDWNPPDARFDSETIVNIGDTVTLDASESYDNMGGIAQYTWYIKHNATKWMLTGQVVTLEAHEWGPYEIKLAVTDFSGNTGTRESTIIALPEGFEADQVSWTETPFGQDVSFNLLTYAYGIALLASVIFIGGLFSKGFAHEIQKGTVKVLFFGPVSVTSVIFSKLLYPIIIGPLFVFPPVFIGLMQFNQSVEDIFMITVVSYLLTVLVLVSAAYGSCLIYLAAKRMLVKPTVLTRVFMYLSLVGTMTVFEWLSFLMDMRFDTDQWGELYLELGPGIAMFSPFHQGGVLLSDLILGSGGAVDWWVFAIPAVLIAAGVYASHRLYPDIFSRE